jgi:superkiller protein 3
VPFSFGFRAALLPLLLVSPVGPQTAPAIQDHQAEVLAAEYDSAVQAREWPRAVTAARQLVELSAVSKNLKLLADAQLISGMMEEALASYDRAIATAEKEKPARGEPEIDWKEGVAKIYVGKGNALLKLHRDPEAVKAYSRSAELAANPAQAYLNVCAVLYNAGNKPDAIAACRKSLQADPAKADAWFIIGSALYGNSTIDAKGNIVITAETRQALEKYLELTPNGPHSADVKVMLDAAAK